MNFLHFSSAMIATSHGFVTMATVSNQKHIHLLIFGSHEVTSPHPARLTHTDSD
jgi:hypothetical protein